MVSNTAPSSVLIVDGDEDIRSALRLLLEAEGYTVLEAAQPHAALVTLRAISDCTVVIFSNTEPSDRHALTFFTQVAADSVLATRHAYIYLTTVPGKMLPALVSVLETLAAPVLAKPFDIVLLLAAVFDAAARLA